MGERCVACGKPIVLVNIDKLRGIVGLTYGWVHVSRWRVRHAAIPPGAIHTHSGESQGGE